MGKTSLLEAITIFASGGDIDLLNSILVRRKNLLSIASENKIESAISIFSTLYTEFSEEHFSNDPIEFSENESSSIKLQFEAKMEDNISGSLYQPKTNAIKIDQDNGAFSVIHDFATLFQKEYSAHPKYVCGIIGSEAMPLEKLTFIHDKIVHENLKNELVEALKIIEPRINDIDFLQEPFSTSSLRLAYVVVQGYKKRIKLSNMGEGTNRILAIILAMLNCKDGIFILDEFDNGLHYSVQEQLWKIIFTLAEQHNIQVFATTHSNDCVRSFATIAKGGEGQLIRLQLIDNIVEAVIYNEADVLECVATSDIEIR